MHRLAYGVIATEGERYIRDTARDITARTVFSDVFACIDEIERIVIVFFDSSRNSKNVGIEHDIFGGKTDHVS